MMTVSQMPSGLRYAVRRYGNAVGYCALSIKIGSRDEGLYHSGIAHFLEHTLFKGTSRRSSASINNRLERLGGELNAFTTKEEIVLHATVLKKDLAKAASLLAEIAFDASFPEDEIEIEKGVVCDEIASYKDFPAEEIYDRFEEKIFAGSPLSRSILGTEQSVRAIDSAELRRFREEFFTPDRMVMTMVSSLEEDKMKAMIVKAFEPYLSAVTGSSPVGELSLMQDPVSVSEQPFNMTVDKGNNQTNCVMGALAPSLRERERRLATLLLCNILGGPASNSMLGSCIREKHGWAYNIECNYTPYSDSGVATINFGCDKNNLKNCIRAIHRQIRKLQDAPLSEAALNRAKYQMLGQHSIGMENGEAQCLSMGKSILSFGHVSSESDVTGQIMGINAAQLQQQAREVFDIDRMSTLIFL